LRTVYCILPQRTGLQWNCAFLRIRHQTEIQPRTFMWQSLGRLRGRQRTKREGTFLKTSPNCPVTWKLWNSWKMSPDQQRVRQAKLLLLCDWLNW
jgi:hypothetical protein